MPHLEIGRGTVVAHRAVVRQTLEHGVELFHSTGIVALCQVNAPDVMAYDGITRCLGLQAQGFLKKFPRTEERIPAKRGESTQQTTLISRRVGTLLAHLPFLPLTGIVRRRLGAHGSPSALQIHDNLCRKRPKAEYRQKK